MIASGRFPRTGLLARVDGSPSLAHTVTVARDSGIILWTAKMPFQVDSSQLGQFHEKAILRQLTDCSFALLPVSRQSRSERMVAGNGRRQSRMPAAVDFAAFQ